MAISALKQYDQAIEWARRAIAIGPTLSGAHRDLIAALALAGHEAEGHEALQRYLAPSQLTRGSDDGQIDAQRSALLEFGTG